jgi:hypothetical protein
MTNLMEYFFDRFYLCASAAIFIVSMIGIFRDQW